MDVGIFMVSSRRLKIWLILPPLLIVTLGLGSHAWRQRAQWQLQETQAFSELLPSLITARKDANQLIEGFGISEGGELGSEDQLISFLQDMAQQNDFLVDTVSMVDRKQQQSASVLYAVVRGAGDFTAVQLYINEAKSKQRLLSVDSIRVLEADDRSNSGSFEVEIVFELLLLNDLKVLGGGMQ